MKKIIFLVLCLAGISLSAAEALPSRVKIDINGRNSGIAMSDAVVSGGLRIIPAKWVPETERSNYLIFESGELTDSWQEFEFSFVPQANGVVRLMVRGNWTKKNGMIRMVAYDKFSFTGCGANNGNFETTKNNTISGWQLRDVNMNMNKADAADGRNLSLIHI